MVKAIESKEEFDALVRSKLGNLTGSIPDAVPLSRLTATSPWSLTSVCPQSIFRLDIVANLGHSLGATWCGPCKMISPHFEKAEAAFENVVFVKVDVDEQPVRHNLLRSSFSTHHPPLLLFYPGGFPGLQHPSDAHFLGFQERREDRGADWCRPRQAQGMSCLSMWFYHTDPSSLDE
jgi:thiol-disulfide isomerase/thioredoxin